MHYTTRAHTAFAAANYQAHERLGLFANLVMNDGRGSMGGINLDVRQIPAVPAGFDYGAVSEIGRFSALSARRIQQVYGLNYQFHPHWTLSWVAYHGRYRDRQPYLYHAGGRSAGVEGGLNYVF
jgi:hypothetical protein